ncbi:biotin--[acetyl-CoA-carboxylase] ligase [Sphingomonas sp. M1-B02]|uniref:biotin--[acetyl-CoA-carboxylase] ligase n=1 Tax=Sphingomonas sp. M1-B02 TaxID=3114300 RepID=UPI0022402DAB|nr:biotin--[acetyl-CoA-carboxylase] ligase [Sphingomonas sp. S6-11]UZK66803.1 biotin--[acetyl-CoA-carboxylase] ligase [Sphingomonas sp. S6-11]
MTIRTVAETGSTNADVLELARGGAAEGLWLRAERQTSGRGRQGRAWVSPVGNLYVSTLVRLRPSDPAAATLALVAAVALEESVSTFLFPGEGRGSTSGSSQLGPGLRRGDVQLKWPNDLLVGSAKISGILLERADDAVVIGFGVNIAHKPDGLDRVATSMAEHGVTPDPDLFAETQAEAFERWLSRWRGEGLGPVRERWLARAHPKGTALTARLADGSTIDGLFDGLDSGGALILRLADGTARVIHAADVFLL